MKLYTHSIFFYLGMEIYTPLKEHSICGIRNFNLAYAALFALQYCFICPYSLHNYNKNSIEMI